MKLNLRRFIGIFSILFVISMFYFSNTELSTVKLIALFIGITLTFYL